MRNIDALKVASAKLRENDSALNKLYYYYFLMKVQEQYNDNKNEINTVASELSEITGVEYSGLLYPVITVDKNSNIEVNEESENEYRKYIQDSMWYIDTQVKVVENFMYINESIKELLSLYIFRVRKRVKFKDIKDIVIAEARRMLNKVDIEYLPTEYIRELYCSALNLFNTFILNDSRDIVDYLYMTSGINFMDIDISNALEELEK